MGINQLNNIHHDNTSTTRTKRVQEDLLTYFDDIPDDALRGMCDIIVNNFNKYEGQTNE